MQEYVIRPAPNQDFGAFVRYVVGLADGSRVETDTSGSPYFVRVNQATYRRWVATLPKPAAPPAPPEPAPPAATEAAAVPVAPPAPAPPTEPQPDTEPELELVPVKKATKKAAKKPRGKKLWRRALSPLRRR